MTTINAIANRIGLRAEVVMVNNNPNMPDFEGDHWKVTPVLEPRGLRKPRPALGASISPGGDFHRRG